MAAATFRRPKEEEAAAESRGAAGEQLALPEAAVEQDAVAVADGKHEQALPAPDPPDPAAPLTSKGPRLAVAFARSSSPTFPLVRQERH
ncbi:MAG: hypothetical protein FJ125_16775 [Deltaproteobacteria bacterium]|nr:hypothetical protein [Deltaproteobacteria bacterium]